MTQFRKRLLEPRSATLVARTVAAAFIVCLLVYLPTVRARPEAFALPKETTLQVGALIATLVWLATCRRIVFDKLDLAVGVVLALAIVSTLVAAENKSLAWRATGLSASLSLLFWNSRAAKSDDVLIASLFGVAVLAVLILFESYGIVSGVSLPRHLPGGTVGNRNQAASILILSVPLLWHVGIRDERSIVPKIVTCLFALITAAIVLGRSRSTWLTGLILIGLISCSLPFVGPVLRRRTIRFVLGGALGAIVALVAPNNLRWNAVAPYRDSALRLFDYENGSGRGRIIQARNTLRMATEHPLLGVGPGNWPIQYPRFATPGDPSYHERALLPTDRLPQNDWFGAIAERGYLFLLGTGVVLVILASGAVREVSRERIATTSIALVGVVVGVIVTGLLNPVLSTPTAGCFVALSIGAMSPRGPIANRSSTSFIKRDLRMLRGSIAFLFVAVGALFIGLVGNVRSLISLELVGHQPSLRSVEMAVRIDPNNYEVNALLARYWMHRYRCDLARPYIRRAAQLYPTATPPRDLDRYCSGF